MQLISARFFAFLAVTFIFYYLCPKKHRWVILSGFSLAFYAFSGYVSLIFILINSLSSYAFALCLQKCRKEGSGFAQKANLTSAVTFTVCLWAFSRAMEAHPLGISFYSLRVISYLFEVKRGRLRAQRNFLKYLLFTAFFPISVLGPIAEYGKISDSLFSGKGTDGKGFLSGLTRLLWGIFKKCVIANLLSEPLSKIYGNPDSFSGAYILFLLIFYSAEIYCDFSGGIDIALGVSGMLGVDLPENFNRPFASRNLREFWNRWHITLGEWFEKYVFYPLSLSKPMQRLSKLCRRRLGVTVGKRIPVYTATLLTWLLTGLWHGARWNFVAWGLINGILVVLSQEMSFVSERFYEKHPSVKGDGVILTSCARARVFLIIGAVRLLDVYKSPKLTAKQLGTVFYDVESYKSFFGGGLFALINVPALLILSVALIAVFFVSATRTESRDIAEKPMCSALCVFGLILLSLVFGKYGMGFDLSDFIYSQY